MTDPLIDRMLTLAQTRAAGIGPDGMARDPVLEERINQTCRNVLNSPDGQVLMQYLRQITTNRILGPGASDAELRYIEGQRALVSILDIRRTSQPA